MPKTNAEVCQRYRQRKKSENAAQAQPGVSVPIKKAMTAVERMRLHRLRKKNIKMALNENESLNHGSSSVLGNPDMHATTPEPLPDSINITVDQVNENVRDSSVSPIAHDNRNFIIVQAQVHEHERSSTFDNCHTSLHTCLLYTSRCV